MNKFPEKKSVTIQTGEYSPYDFEGSLKNLKNYIDGLIATHGDDVYFSWDADFHHPYETSPSPRFLLMKTREETDDEFNYRVAQEKLNNEMVKKRELAEFERLSKKYGEK